MRDAPSPPFAGLTVAAIGSRTFGSDPKCREASKPEGPTPEPCKILEVRRTNPLSTSGAADFAPSADMNIANKDVL